MIFSHVVAPVASSFSPVSLQRPTSRALARIDVNLRALLDQPSQIVEGGIWGSLWAFSVLFSGNSLYNLYHTCKSEHPAAEKFHRIGVAVKNAFVDISSLVGGTGYVAHWAHQARVIQLGRYVFLAKSVSYGGALVSSLLEGGYNVYCIHIEKEKILNAPSSIERERHKQRLCLQLMKLIGNISMIAWTALGIATLTTSIFVSPILMSAFLGISSLFAATAYFYQRHPEDSTNF